MRPGLDDTMAVWARAVEERLAAELDDSPRAGEIARPERLLAAMRHATLGGGKRLRPALFLATLDVLGPPPGGSDPMAAAVALEVLHGYSLVHDDLPSMDDDDMRRGRPTVHRAFDEATAILAGDALQALAFDLLARPSSHPDPSVRADLVLQLARAAGLGGMVGGQMLDLAAEGRFADGRPLALDAPAIERLQMMKTGVLIRAACTMAARFGGADPDTTAAIERYGSAVGLSFQLADDILDATGDAAVLGKAAAKDAAAGKGTLVSLLGLERASAMRDGLAETAKRALAGLGPAADRLADLADFVAQRDR